jgi:NAD-dependent SIR2 family protein deacetylase
MLDALHTFVAKHPKLFVLTGAGASTDSGIPGYRDADGRWTRTAPVYFQDFLRSESSRRRYWSRSMAGWPMLAGARPNDAHVALARLEARGYVAQLVTQNVDGLHRHAGSRMTIELHGNIHRVTCLDCGARFSRASVQQALEAANTQALGTRAKATPDGDADVAPEDLAAFRNPSCARCGGTVKPDVVFFGECVPKERVETARTALEQASAMLVIGSSLMVYSGYRFCEWAAKQHKPIAAVNLGRTRADALFALKVSEPCGRVLAALAERLDNVAEPRARAAR